MADPTVSTMKNQSAVASAREPLRDLRQQFPEYGTTGAIDDLRAREFRRLDDGGHVYLDYTGGGLYPDSLVGRHTAFLLSHVLGNPHSLNPTSSLSSELLGRCRSHVLAFFNASADEYTVVFTANASHALKLVGEAYPFASDGVFLLTIDNHNSVNGIREFARHHGARTLYVPVAPPDMRADHSELRRQLRQDRGTGHNLFAYPAQSNFSGVQHPLGWISEAQAEGWDVLLDAAAFVPTNRLDLGRWHPDFVVLSFYKMFGYPTGIGALIGRRAALEKLHRPWFAGGTITVASVQPDRHYLAQGSAAFEDGTPNYLSMPAVDFGIDLIESVGIDVIHRRVRALTGWMIEHLGALHHETGESLVRLYGPRTIEARGATLAFNLFDKAGHPIDHRTVERKAAAERISLRTGCFCNPGAGETALGLSSGELAACFQRSPERMSTDDFRACFDRKTSGAVRVSLGLASNFNDAEAFIRFASTFLNADDVGAAGS